MKKMFVITAAAIALATVAAAPGMVQAKTPVYKAADAGGGAGYTTASVGDNRYMVTYTGEPRMKKDKVVAYAMLRAAEFTEESGQEWFAVLSSTTEQIEVGGAGDMATRTGPFMGSGQTAAGGTGADTSSGGGTASSGTFNAGASSGGFGGGDVPPAVLERWNPKKVVQTVLVIQMGSGDEASFPGVTTQPPIFDAKQTVADVRAAIK